METYNPKIDGWRIVDCPCWDKIPGWCNILKHICPVEADTNSIPTDCPARGEGILIQVKE